MLRDASICVEEKKVNEEIIIYLDRPDWIRVTKS